MCGGVVLVVTRSENANHVRFRATVISEKICLSLSIFGEGGAQCSEQGVQCNSPQVGALEGDGGGYGRRVRDDVVARMSDTTEGREKEGTAPEGEACD